MSTTRVMSTAHVLSTVVVSSGSVVRMVSTVYTDSVAGCLRQGSSVTTGC